MGMAVRFLVGAACLLATLGGGSAASCPSEQSHGKTLTFSGTVARILKQDDGGFQIAVKECKFSILTRSAPGCRSGSKIRASGQFDWCYDEGFFGCMIDVLHASNASCSQ